MTLNRGIALRTTSASLPGGQLCELATLTLVTPLGAEGRGEEAITKKVAVALDWIASENS